MRIIIHHKGKEYRGKDSASTSGEAQNFVDMLQAQIRIAPKPFSLIGENDSLYLFGPIAVSEAVFEVEGAFAPVAALPAVPQKRLRRKKS